MGGGRTGSNVDELMAQGENFATEANQATMISHLSAIAEDVKPLSGAGTTGTRALAVADTWYSVPSTVPASDYVLVVSKENADGTMRWSFLDTSLPSTTFGNKFTSDDIVFELAANQVVYFSSTQAGDDVNWTTKII